VILETGFLREKQIRLGCRAALHAGAAFVKTSTGFGPRGASLEDIQIMFDEIGGKMGIKASGGIRTREAALKMLEAGASRIGASSTFTILGI
jgi:deoxyribose-phosphate aldolase